MPCAGRRRRSRPCSGWPGRSSGAPPYQAHRDFIIVRAHLNGLGLYNFVLDTGVNTSLLLDEGLRDSLQLRLGQRFRVMGTGVGEVLDVYQVDGVRVTLPCGVVGPAVSFLMLGPNDLNFSGFVGLPVRGILGADVFRSFVVAINPAAGQLVLHRPARYQAPKGKLDGIAPGPGRGQTVRPGPGPHPRFGRGGSAPAAGYRRGPLAFARREIRPLAAFPRPAGPYAPGARPERRGDGLTWAARPRCSWAATRWLR